MATLRAARSNSATHLLYFKAGDTAIRSKPKLFLTRDNLCLKFFKYYLIELELQYVPG